MTQLKFQSTSWTLLTVSYTHLTTTTATTTSTSTTTTITSTVTTTESYYEDVSSYIGFWHKESIGYDRELTISSVKRNNIIFSLWYLSLIHIYYTIITCKIFGNFPFRRKCLGNGLIYSVYAIYCRTCKVFQCFYRLLTGNGWNLYNLCRCV